MKKSMTALAALAGAGMAAAESSLTVFGVADISVSRYVSQSQRAGGGTASAGQTALTPSSYQASRLGFRGKEDLGGGLAASFWLEMPVRYDEGQPAGLAFVRRSTLSLSGPFGEIRMGHDYTPTFWNDNIFTPFASNGIGGNLITSANDFRGRAATAHGFADNPAYVRASNSVSYFLPSSLHGFYGHVMLALHEKPAGQARAGRYAGARAGYSQGSLNAAVAYGVSTVADGPRPGRQARVEMANAGISYDFGAVKLFGEYSRTRMDRGGDAAVAGMPGANPAANPAVQGWLIGASLPVGTDQIRLAYSAVRLDASRGLSPASGDPRADLLALGYVRNLSKRTALYATVARLGNRNGYDLGLGGPAYPSGPGVTPRRSTGLDLGIRHVF